MSLFARIFGLTALFVAIVLPTLSAQDKKDDKKAVAKDGKDDAKKDAVKKDAIKKDAKDDAKKDAVKKDAVKKDVAAKKDAKKDDDKKKVDKSDPKSKVEEEKIVYGGMVKAKLSKMEANSKGEFSIQPFDNWKANQFNQWKIQQLVYIMQAANPKELFDRRLAFQNALPGRSMDVYGKEVEVRIAEKMKIRTIFPPTRYDDTGNLMKWTVKDLKELRGNTKLAGYPAEMDALKAGQMVDVYFAKVQGPTPGAKKKKNIDDDLDAMMMRPEVVLIIVTMEAPPRQ